MKKSSTNNVTAINQSNSRKDGSTAERLNSSTVPTAINSSNYSDVIERLKTVECNPTPESRQ